VLLSVREINRAAEDVEHATILVRTSDPHQPIVHLLRVFTSEIGNLPVSQVPKIDGQALPDARDRLKLVVGVFHSLNL